MQGHPGAMEYQPGILEAPTELWSTVAHPGAVETIPGLLLEQCWLSLKPIVTWHVSAITFAGLGRHLRSEVNFAMAPRWLCCLADLGSETRVSAVTSGLWSVQSWNSRLSKKCLKCLMAVMAARISWSNVEYFDSAMVSLRCTSDATRGIGRICGGHPQFEHNYEINLPIILPRVVIVKHHRFETIGCAACHPFSPGCQDQHADSASAMLVL
jgi:hypothetical protein